MLIVYSVREVSSGLVSKLGKTVALTFFRLNSVRYDPGKRHFDDGASPCK